MTTNDGSEQGADDVIDSVLAPFTEDLKECMDFLLQDIPDGQGLVTKETLKGLIRAAFAGGVVSAMEKGANDSRN